MLLLQIQTVQASQMLLMLPPLRRCCCWLQSLLSPMKIHWMSRSRCPLLLPSVWIAAAAASIRC